MGIEDVVGNGGTGAETDAVVEGGDVVALGTAAVRHSRTHHAERVAAGHTRRHAAQCHHDVAVRHRTAQLAGQRVREEIERAVEAAHAGRGVDAGEAVIGAG